MDRKTSPFLSIGLSAALVAVAIWFLFNHYGVWASGYWQMPHGMMIGGAGLSFLMLLFWGVVIGAMVMLVSVLFSGRHSVAQTESALDILDKRYARGGIDKVRYDAMRHDLVQKEVSK